MRVFLSLVVASVVTFAAMIFMHAFVLGRPEEAVRANAALFCGVQILTYLGLSNFTRRR